MKKSLLPVFAISGALAQRLPERQNPAAGPRQPLDTAEASREVHNIRSDNNNNNNTSQNASQNVSPAQTRTLNVRLMAAFANFDDYGCWCHFDEKWTMGKGTPVDDFDMQCKQLARNYNCIFIDAYDENLEDNSCIPWDVRYLEPRGLNFDTSDAEIISQCRYENEILENSDCKIRTCIVESTFIRNTYHLMHIENQRVNMEYKVWNGFDHSKNCKPPPNFPNFPNDGFGDDEEHSSNGYGNGLGFDGDEDMDMGGARKGNGYEFKECCGEYPNREPFSISSNFGCCEGSIYNSYLNECCADGSVASWKTCG